MALRPRSSKPYIIKAPPQTAGVLPLLLYYPIDPRSPRGGATRVVKRLHLDFSGVSELDVLGLACFTVNVAKAMERHPDFEVQVVPPHDVACAAKLRHVRLVRLLLQLGMNVNRTRDFWEKNADAVDDIPFESASLQNGAELLIFVPNAQITAREERLSEVMRLVKDFLKRHASRSINPVQVHPIFHEIVKNTLDHSGSSGLLALKVEVDAGKPQRLKFVHCEMGKGISLHIREYFKAAYTHPDARLGKKGATSDFLVWAFTPGNSTKLESGVNAGLGLATIRAAAKGGGIRVYCSDADSILYVTDFPLRPSHKTTRRCLYHVNEIPCFMYFGETT